MAKNLDFHNTSALMKLGVVFIADEIEFEPKSVNLYK